MCPVLSDHAWQEWSLDVKPLPSFLLSITGFALLFNLGGIPILTQIEQIRVMSGRDCLPIMSSLYHRVRIVYQNVTGGSQHLCYLPKSSQMINLKKYFPLLLGTSPKPSIVTPNSRSTIALFCLTLHYILW